MNVSKNDMNMDLTFIGSGISSTFTLIYLLQKLREEYNSDTINICIVEKFPEFFKGIPYGKRSGDSVLLITSLKNFLPEPEYSLFIDWLNKNKERLLHQMLKDGGDLTIEWVKKHAVEIENNKWGDLFVPRSFFGVYIREKVTALIEELTNKRRIKVSFKIAEANAVEKTTTGYCVITPKEKFNTKKLILGIGSLPTKRIYTDHDVINTDSLLLINQVYSPNLSENLNLMYDFQRKRKAQQLDCNVLIIGANASALEILYKLNDKQHTEKGFDHFTFLSTYGLLPDCEINTKKLAQYQPENLTRLKEKQQLSAEEIAQATYKDLNNAEAIELGAASTVSIISNAFGPLLSKLSQEELKKFACKYGNEIGRRQRCAGQHYLDTVAALKDTNKFSHIAGRFYNLKSDSQDNHYLEYKETASEKLTTSAIPYHIVINCIGSTSFQGKQVPEILRDMVKKGYCTPNASQIGVEVNTRLEAAENLHIIGPLLAGNIVENKAVWHVEHCGRITWLSGILADTLFSDFSNITEKAITLP